MFLLVGGDLEIGAATERHFRSAGLAVMATTRRHERAGPERPFLDLSVPLDDWQPPPCTTAACIFAAMARIAACEADPAASAFINVEQTLAVADLLLQRGAHVVFLSSNQVFDGSRSRVQCNAATCPISTYGRQKAQAEASLIERAAAGMPVAILRLAKVVSPDMPLMRGWVNDLGAGRTVRAFTDMMMAPVPVEAVARAVANLLGDRATGIFQLTGPRDVSYADVARHLAARLGVDPRLVDPVSAHCVGQPSGATPRHTTLDFERFRKQYGLVVPDAFEVLEQALSL